MRATPREGAESPQQRYEDLLHLGIAIQKEYESHGARIGKLYDEGKDDEAEALEEQDGQLLDSISHQLRQRVEILRTMEHLQTIEEVFPRVKGQKQEERKQVDAAELIRMFNAGKIGVDDIRAAAKSMEPSSDKLNDEEMKAYAKARYDLALAMGYEKASPEEGWFEVERSGVSIQMKQFAFPSEFGITGFSRISKISAMVKKHGKATVMMNYDRGWDVACTDPKVQREIDRAVAIFG